MSKSNFLLVDLNEPKTKKLAETITSDTSRKILNHLTEKEDTEANIATILSLPISTVHYHLQKLQEAGLVIVDEFHYSSKGREINHYKLANKYIIIAPQKISGLREKLKGILPVSIAAVAFSFILKLYTKYIQISTKAFSAVQEQVAEYGSQKTAPVLAKAAEQTTALVENAAAFPASPDIALWFLIGSASTIVLYILFSYFKEKWKK